MSARGWFATHGRKGDRTLDEQLTGLDPLLAEVRGKSVLDVGCAEGLIAIECAKAGASRVVGVEIVGGHLIVAQQHAVGLPCYWLNDDANTFEPRAYYDVGLLLAVLHKLRDPSEACLRIVERVTDLVVIRLPPEGAPVIVDERSKRKPHDIGAVMQRAGFELQQITRGHLLEWCGYFRRVRK